ncbi:MIZ zinc finger protein [Paecilomyces variotii No. 5]|uniref:MIZ zinc finger protein n=1 Tax=Byssochlamys spectabilis (strain No. 5 / NBRC 109023) TaxID=1356009 RepID=V5I5H5_BYSSN|nr:MIZ zinc finger protein [Paecilomyces variotii No. 5]
MASPGQAPPDLQSINALIKTLTNAQLKDILRSEGLTVSGVKVSLQLRIIDYIERLYKGGHIDRYNLLKKFIYATAQRSMPSSPSLSPSAHPHTSSTLQAASAQSRPSALGPFVIQRQPVLYHIRAPYPDHGMQRFREHTRDSVELRVVLNPSIAAKLQNDPNIRVMVYCAADTGLNQYSKSDIAFPHQVELKANLDEVKANLRGLKNKPGSTRPADVTNYIRKKPGYPNHIVMTYALTQKKFFVLVNLVQRHPVEELVARLKARKTISKEQVIREMRSRAEDSDIITTSSVMSLKCPLSTLRIEVPCRSVICTHNQCFDASSFLQLQEQAPTWTCPVCNKATSFESLQIDQYVDDILRSTPAEVDQVIVEPTGQWSNPKDEGQPQNGGGVTPTTDDEDDLIEIKEPPAVPLKQEPLPVHITLQRTPAQSREPSTTSSATRPSSNKRSAAQVIDLTASDDEDTPPRQPKRQALSLPGQLFPQHRLQGSYSHTSGNGTGTNYSSQNGF